MLKTNGIRGIIIGLIAVVFLAITGCSASPFGSSIDAISADGAIPVDSGPWGDGDDGSVDAEDGEIVVEADDDTGSDYDGGSNTPGNPSPSGECSYAEHSIEGLVSKVADFGDEIDISISVVGGSGNFYWYDPSSNLPQGLEFTSEGSSASISGTVADFAEPGDYTITIKVTDLDCSRSVQDTVTIKINKPKPELDWVPPDMHVIDPQPPAFSINATQDADKNEAQDLNETNGPKVMEIRVRIDTADVEGAGTDAGILIQFCADKDLKICRDPVFLDDPARDDHERGAKGWYRIQTGAPFSKHEIQYFKIIFTSLNDIIKQDIEDMWLFQGIRVEYVMKDGKKELAYANPCVLRWIYGFGEYLEFGPNDQAVCAIITTGCRNNSGTDNDVWLEFPDSTIDNVQDGEHLVEDLWGGRFVRYGEESDSGSLLMSLNWRDDDFQPCRRASYGEYSFGRKFFVSTERDKGVVGIRKESDNPHGGWFLENIRVYIWNPAVNIKYGDDCRVGDSCRIEIEETLHVLARNPGVWIEDETELEVYWKVSNEDSWSSTFTRSDFNNMGSYR